MLSFARVMLCGLALTGLAWSVTSEVAHAQFSVIQPQGNPVQQQVPVVTPQLEARLKDMGAGVDPEEISELLKAKRQALELLQVQSTGTSVNSDVSDLPQQLQQLQALLENPMTRVIVNWMRTPGIFEKLKSIFTHPSRTTLIACEIGLLILFFILRSWRLSKIEQSRWLARLGASLGIFAGYWLVAVVVLPSYFFGAAYTEVVASLIRAVLAG